MNSTLLNYIKQFKIPYIVYSYLFSIRHELNWDIPIDDEDLSSLLKDRVITRDYVKSTFKLNVPFYESDILTDIILNPSISIDDRINEYRHLFKVARVGNMGVKANVLTLMKQFLHSHQEITFDDVLNATAYYIQNTDSTYINNAENFIYKNVNGNIVSKLETVLEEYALHKSNLL